MVLPRCILFPHAMLPLHIFEERYRRMLEDILSSHRMFGIGTIRRNPKGRDDDEKEGIYDVLGVGIVRVAIGKPDGTSDLILQGLCRARVTSVLDGTPYRRVHFEALASEEDPSVTVDALAAKVTELARQRAQLGDPLPENAMKFLTTLRDPGCLCDLVSFTLIEDCHAKQGVLEELNLRERLRKVISLLTGEIARLQLAESLKGKTGDDRSKLN